MHKSPRCPFGGFQTSTVRCGTRPRGMTQDPVRLGSTPSGYTPYPETRPSVLQVHDGGTREGTVGTLKSFRSLRDDRDGTVTRHFVPGPEGWCTIPLLSPVSQRTDPLSSTLSLSSQTPGDRCRPLTLDWKGSLQTHGSRKIFVRKSLGPRETERVVESGSR